MARIRFTGRGAAGKSSGDVLLKFVVAGLVGGLGWIWWHTARTEVPPGSPLPPAFAPAPSQAAPALTVTKTSLPPGTVTIPRPDRPDDPIVLVPATAASRDAATNAATNLTRAESEPFTGSQQKILEAQLALERQGISCGSLDGVFGGQTRAGFNAYLLRLGSPRADGELFRELQLPAGTPLYLTHTVTSNDLGCLQPVGRTWLAKSQQECLDYETLLELVAEKFHAHPTLLRRLNPAFDWTNAVPGVALKVPNAELVPGRGRVAAIKIFLGARALQAFDENTNLLVHFPCSIARRVEKRPVGETLRVETVAPNPDYTFDPEVFPESEEARQLQRKLRLPPGPNNPVGTAWIGLDKPGYGIHGTPRPEDVGRTESHGCFRLANWNADHLARLVRVGTPVMVEP